MSIFSFFNILCIILSQISRCAFDQNSKIQNTKMKISSVIILISYPAIFSRKSPLRKFSKHLYLTEQKSFEVFNVHFLILQHLVISSQIFYSLLGRSFLKNHHFKNLQNFCMNRWKIL